jgi:hypothetical protein
VWGKNWLLSKVCTRTDDLLITSQLLYQLSYTGKNALCASINIPKGQGSVKGFLE